MTKSFHSLSVDSISGEHFDGEHSIGLLIRFCAGAVR